MGGKQRREEAKDYGNRETSWYEQVCTIRLIILDRGDSYLRIYCEEIRMGRKLCGNIDTVAVMINWWPREHQGCNEDLDRII